MAASRARPRRRLGAALAAALVGGTVAAPPARAYETDQYSNRLEPIADSESYLDRVVNEALAGVAQRWIGGEDRLRFAVAVWDQLGGLFWVDRIERLAMKSAEVERLPQHRWQSIYKGAPFWATRVGFLFGVGRTIRLAGSLTGSDKLGHFFSQGLKYYRSHLEGWNEERIAGRGRFNERWLFGQWTTSVYSNADLVANWEGYRFYRSLFEDGIVPGKGPIVRFHNGQAEIARPFAWSDHVNDYWDEALNPSHWGASLERALRPKLEELCGEYAREPAAWVPRRAAELAGRYALLGLRAAPENRLDTICAPAPTAAAQAGDNRPPGGSP